LTYKEQQELAEFPAKIEGLEAEQVDIGNQLADGEIYKNAPEHVKILQARLQEIEHLLENYLARWEALDAKAK
jgi:ABC transport system ATP-binding/permease protein